MLVGIKKSDQLNDRSIFATGGFYNPTTSKYSLSVVLEG